MTPDDDELSSLIRQHATRHPAPDALRAGIRTQIALVDAGRAAPPAAEAPRQRMGHIGWRSAAAGFALGLVCAMVVPPLLQRAADEPLDALLVGDHVRALRVGPLTEVASSDRHTVKPWFQGRLDYAPPVLDFAVDGFPLIGGRIEHVHGNAVAALAYARRRHVVDLFVWPGGAVQVPLRSAHRGFNVLHWGDGAMQYWAVSDLDAAELAQFAQRWRESAPN